MSTRHRDQPYRNEIYLQPQRVTAPITPKLPIGESPAAAVMANAADVPDSPIGAAVPWISVSPRRRITNYQRDLLSNQRSS